MPWWGVSTTSPVRAPRLALCDHLAGRTAPAAWTARANLLFPAPRRCRRAPHVAMKFPHDSVAGTCQHSHIAPPGTADGPTGPLDTGDCERAAPDGKLWGHASRHALKDGDARLPGSTV